MTLKDWIEVLAIVVPLLTAGIGAYVKLKEDIAGLKRDVHNLAFMMKTKRAVAEREANHEICDSGSSDSTD